MPSSTESAQIELAVAAAQRLGRRDFLKFTAASAALAATGFFPDAAQAAVPQGIRFMEEAEFAVFQRLTQVTLPVKGTQLAPLDSIPVMQTLDAALLGGMAPHELQGLGRRQGGRWAAENLRRALQQARRQEAAADAGAPPPPERGR
jgi:hypothetical protein